MKKISIKSLLVLVLVLVLVLSIGLVACNKKKNNDTPDPTPVTPSGGGDDTPAGIDKDSYFGNMWDLANDIGGEAITASDNVALSLDLSVAMRQMKSDKVEEENFNIGVKLDLVLDRNSKDASNNPLATNSAVRALIYNGATGETWCAVYYFLSDPNFVYFDLNGAKDVEFLSSLIKDRYYKVAFVTDGNGNAAYAGSVADFIKNHRFAEKKDNDDNVIEGSGFTIADIVNAVVSGTGKDWTLNTLIDNIASLFNLDLKGIAKKVGSLLPGMYDEATNSVHIEKALSSSIVKSLLGEPTMTEKDGRKEYAVSLNVGKVLGLAKDMLKDLPGIVTTILNENTEIGIKYGEKDDKIDGFALTLGLKGLKDSKTNLYPQVEIAINNLELRKVENTAAAAKARVGFTASNWANAKTIDLNNMLKAEASVEVELYQVKEVEGVNQSVMTPYRVTMYTDIDVIDIIKKVVEMCKDEKTWAQRAEILKTIKGELGLKVEEIDAQGALVPDAPIPFQLLVSCAEGELSAVIGEKAYIIDAFDILGNWDKFLPEDDEDDEQGAPAAGGFDISGIMDALDLIKETVKINGQELSLDVLKEAFLDENGELKKDWHTFTLDANFTKEICNQLCEKFGGKNDNEVSVNIQKDTATHIKARAEYLNDPVVGTGENERMTQYFVEVEANWKFDEANGNLFKNSGTLTLKFNMWDENAGKVVTYVCTLTGHVNMIHVGTGENAYQLLKDGTATLSLTRQYADEQAASPVFVAQLDGNVVYTANNASIGSATLDLVVSKDGSTAADKQLFDIHGMLEVSGTGSVLVKFTDDGCKYVVDGDVQVETTIRENLVKFIGGLEVNYEDEEEVEENGEMVTRPVTRRVAISAYPIPESAISILQMIGLVPKEYDPNVDGALTVGELLGNCHINMDKENVISTSYTRSVNATTHVETEGFVLALNELSYNGTEYASTGETFHVTFEFRRAPKAASEQVDGEPTKYNVTYVKCVVNSGEGDEGLAIRLDTFDYTLGSVAATSKVTPPARYENDGTTLREGVMLLDSKNAGMIIGVIMMFFN